MRTTKRQREKHPLFLHASGQYAKKCNGRVFYFGTNADKALAAWLAMKDEIIRTGRKPVVTAGVVGCSVHALANRFLAAKKALMESGEISPRTWGMYFETCGFLIEHFGKTREVATLTPEDFTKLRERIADGRKPSSVGAAVQRVRTILAFAFNEGFIDRPARYGSTFKKPTRTVLRKARQLAGTKMMTAADLRRLIDSATTPVRAMTLLVLNGGLGNSDVANLTIEAVDLAGGWLNYPRVKTAVERRIPLWPETIQAIRDAIARRPTPKADADAGLVFVTNKGYRWVNFHRKVDDNHERQGTASDCVALEFGKLLRKLGLHRRGLGFYSLRHIHRTISDRAKDQTACDHIMGHIDGSMAGVYREGIDDDRLLAVVNTVRDWLYEPNPVKLKLVN